MTLGVCQYRQLVLLMRNELMLSPLLGMPRLLLCNLLEFTGIDYTWGMSSDI